MAKSDKEMREELQRIRLAEENKKRDAERAELIASRADAQAKAHDELIKGRTYIDPQGKEVNLWDEAYKLADAAHHSEVRAYDDWRAAMLGLLTMYGMLNRALTQSFKEMRSDISDAAMTGTSLGDIPIFGDALRAIPVYGDFLAAIPTPGVLSVKDAISDYLAGDPEVGLPVLLHKIQLSDDGKLIIEKLSRADNVDNTARSIPLDPNNRSAPVVKSLDEHFDTGVREWLAEQGYKPTAADKDKFVDEHGAALTKTQFDILKNDPEHGFNHFLQVNYSELEFRPRGP